MERWGRKKRRKREEKEERERLRGARNEEKRPEIWDAAEEADAQEPEWWANQALADLGGRLEPFLYDESRAGRLVNTPGPQQKFYSQVGPRTKKLLDETAISGNPGEFLEEKFLSGVALGAEDVYNHAVDLAQMGVQADLTYGYVTDSGLNTKALNQLIGDLLGGKHQAAAEQTEEAALEIAETLPQVAENLRFDLARNWEEQIQNQYNPQGGWSLAGDVASAAGQSIPALAAGSYSGLLSAAVSYMGSAGNAAALAREQMPTITS